MVWRLRFTLIACHALGWQEGWQRSCLAYYNYARLYGMSPAEAWEEERQFR